MAVPLKLTIELNLSEAVKLATHLSSIVGKGSISTTPSWARKIIHKIYTAAMDQHGDEYMKAKKQVDQ